MMVPMLTPRRPRSRASVLMLALLLVPVVSCSTGDDAEGGSPRALSVEPTSPSSGDPSGAATPAPDADATPSAAPTPTATPTPERPSEVGVPRTDLTPEGAMLEPGDEAVLQDNVGFDPTGPAYHEVQYVTRITDVIPGDTADLATDDNNIDAATQDVYYVWSESTLVWARSASPLNTLHQPSVKGWLADGSAASWVFGVGMDQCTGTSIKEPEVGAVAVGCDAVLVPKGQPLSYVGVLGNPDLTWDVHDTPTTTPVLWRVG